MTDRTAVHNPKPEKSEKSKKPTGSRNPGIGEIGRHRAQVWSDGTEQARQRCDEGPPRRRGLAAGA
jgi:hypothetical protein